MDFMKAFMDQHMIAMMGEIVLFANTGPRNPSLLIFMYYSPSFRFHPLVPGRCSTPTTSLSRYKLG